MLKEKIPLSVYKKLLGQTAIYGLSSIVGRLFNYFLVPLHTRVFDRVEFGTVSLLYVYITFLIIVFTYGMETAYFRFSSQKEADENKVYSTSLGSILVSSLLFVALLFLFANPIAIALDIGNAQQYIYYFALILGLDAITAIPFAKLRHQNKAIRFATLKLINIAINFSINLYYLLLCPWLMANGFEQFVFFYNPALGIAYVFIANLVASAFTLLFLYKEIILTKLQFDFVIWKKMMIYAFPLLFAGLAGMVNQSIDRVLLQFLLPFSPEENLAQIGLYSAAYKIAILLVLAIQAYRMAAEPFFFSVQNQQDNKAIYARIMNYFVAFACIVFLGVMFHMEAIQYFLGENFRDSLSIVPIILFANIFLGIYINLSIWYKLADKTMYGLYFTFLGAAVTIGLNVWLIPIHGYIGAAYATFACYFIMAFACYVVGQKHFTVPYNTRRILMYLFLTAAFYFLVSALSENMSESPILRQSFLTSMFIAFSALLFFIERKPIKS